MLTIGIDAHKRTWVAVAVDAAGRPVSSYTTSVSADAVRAIVDWAQTLAHTSGMAIERWGIEGAMHYGRSLAQALVQVGAPVVEVPGSATARERRRSRGREAEKTDVTDATAIARLTLRDGARLPIIGLDGPAAQCHALSEHRDNLVLARTAALHQLYAHLTHTHGTTAPRLAGRQHRPWLAQLVDGVPPPSADPLATARYLVVRQLATMVLAYDALITTLDRELTALAHAFAPSLLAIPGLGALSAAKLLGIVGHIERFPSAAHFAAYAGVAPLEASSGDRQRHRLNRRGHRQLNRVLHIVAVVQRRDYPPAQQYVARKIAEGKSRKEALRALKRQLANVLYRTLTRCSLPAAA